MAKNFEALAFSAAVKETQEKPGSSTTYARVERDTYSDGLTENEVDFIAERESFYRATIGKKGF